MIRRKILNKLASKMSEIDLELKESAELGKKAFHAGKKRVPALDKDLMDLIKKSKGKDGFASNFMKAWLDSWDRENLKQKVSRKLGKEEMSLDDAWKILYDNFVEKTEVVKEGYKLDMSIDSSKKELLRSIYDNAPVKKLYTYSTNKFGFKIDELRVDVDHGNLKIQKLTE